MTRTVVGLGQRKGGGTHFSVHGDVAWVGAGGRIALGYGLLVRSYFFLGVRVYERLVVFWSLMAGEFNAI